MIQQSNSLNRLSLDHTTNLNKPLNRSIIEKANEDFIHFSFAEAGQEELDSCEAIADE